MTAVLLLACRGNNATGVQVEGDTVVFKYATQIAVVRYEGYTVAQLKNPWKSGKTLHTYVLVPANQNLPENLPEGTVLRTPLHQTAVFTAVHCALLGMLHQEQALAGVADLRYVKLPWVHRRVAAGTTVDLGDAMSPVVERIIDGKPDAILLSPFENSGGYGKLEDVNIPIVECAEYMETSPLGRAEWMRFYGMLFGCEQTADSLFGVVDSTYHALMELAMTAKTTCSVITDKVTGSVWYVPGGHSTIGQMMKDANANYVYAGDEHSGSVALPFEAVLEQAGHADVWHFRYNASHDISYAELLSEHHGYSQFDAFKKHNVYGCDVSRSMFYEETPFRPDLLLTDFIQILHPDITNLPPARYYKKVNE